MYEMIRPPGRMTARVPTLTEDTPPHSPHSSPQPCPLSGGRSHRLGAPPRSRQQFPPDPMQIIRQDPVADIAPIAFQSEIQTAVQAMMLQGIDRALDRAMRPAQRP